MTSRPAERREQKHLGAFYSPPALVDPMIAWAVTAPAQTVLDPCSGDGIFIGAAARRLLRLGTSPAMAARQVRAFDLNPEATRFTREALRVIFGAHEPEVRTASFFSLDPPDTLFGDTAVDVIVGNPPYIRYQTFAGDSRSQALNRALSAGVKLTRLASSWAHFVAHASSFLKPGGRLSLILPAELIHASYAAALRRHLRASFEEIHVVSFRAAVFPGAQAEVVLLFAAGRGAPHRRLGLMEVGSAEELGDIDRLLTRSETFAPGVEPEKWVPGYAATPSAACLERLQNAGHYVPLNALGKANIGFVSGANEFFVLSPAEAAQIGLPARSLRPAVLRARHAAGMAISPSTVERMQKANERCLLWYPEDQLSPAERAYVLRGEAEGIAGRYKCRVRSPWWLVPGVIVPDAFLTYMSDAVPRLCLNEAGAVAANTLLTVRLPELPARQREAFVVAFYNSATLLSCERTGRSYGGGVLKLEPREADRILVPSARLVWDMRQELSALAELVQQGLAEGGTRMQEAIAEVDRVLLRATGVSADEAEQIGRARAESVARRRGRARRQNGTAAAQSKHPRPS